MHSVESGRCFSIIVGHQPTTTHGKAPVAKKLSREQVNVFLVMQQRQQCRELADGVRQAGYDVTEYQTGREFLIDKRNHTDGIVLAEYRIYGILGDELANELASERETFPIVLIASAPDTPRAVKAGVDFIVKMPTIDELLEAIRRTLAPEELDEKYLRWGFERLTPSEGSVLDEVVAGKGSREIGLELGVSPRTVEAHRARINATSGN